MWPGENKKWYFNTKTKQVEYGRISNLFDVMGPYDSEEEAREALKKAEESNEKWDEENKAWGEGGDSLGDEGQTERSKIKEDKGEELPPSAIF